MRKYLVFSIIAILFCSDATAQRNYRVRTRNKSEYILPPFTHLKFKGSEVKKDFKYFYILLRGLSDDYTRNLRSLENVERWNGSHDYFDANSKKDIAVNIKGADLAANGCDCNSISGTGFKAAFLLHNGSQFFVQISYEDLVKDPIVENFNKLIPELLSGIASFEGKPACGCASSHKLPPGFAHQLVKKLKEWIPLPADLAQPGTCLTVVDDQSRFLLLDDDLVLKVDNIIKKFDNVSLKFSKIIELEIPSGSTKFQYEWTGFKIHSFTRSPTGLVVENSFGQFNNAPSNRIGTNLYKLASFADIQSSDIPKDRYYLGLYHPPLKRNNNQASSLGGYSASDDNNPMRGNPFLLHFTSAEMAALDFKQAFGPGDGYAKSIFFERGSIEPLITILINGQESFQSIDKLTLQIKTVPPNYTLWRKYGNGFRKVKGNKNATFLLPYDQINYKL